MCSFLGRPFRSIDDDDIDRRALRLQLQSRLLRERGEKVRPRLGRGVRDELPVAGRAVEKCRRPLEMPIVLARQPCSIDDRSAN